MWKILITVAVFAFATIQAQEFCVQCQSSDNNFDCAFPERLANFTAACNVTSGLCFTRVNEQTGHIQRGCASQINSSECDDELCRTCALAAGATQPCNDQVLPVDRLTCYVCEGDRNSTCGSVTDRALHEALCPLYRNDNQCVATRRGDIIHRGCLSNMPNVNCDRTHNCCLGHRCNNWGFEAVRDSALSIHSAFNLSLIALIGVVIGFKNL